MKLHLGCGEKKFDGFVNIDIREEVNPDVIDDISILSEFKDESAELIYACHVLEHFGRYEYLNVLKKWSEILKSEGIIRISVPDIGKVMKMYNDGMSLRSLTGFLYGGQNYPENYHYIGFDYELLKEDLENLGFKDVKKWDWKEVEHGHIDDYSQSYIPHMEKEDGELMSLNIEATKI